MVTRTEWAAVPAWWPNYKSPDYWQHSLEDAQYELSFHEGGKIITRQVTETPWEVYEYHG